MASLDAFERPPEGMRAFYKSLQKLKGQELHTMSNLVNPASLRDDEFKIVNTVHITPHMLATSACMQATFPSQIHYAYESNTLPGLQIIPSLLPESLQVRLLERLLHRDLADERHQTNLHKHYRIPYHLANYSELNKKHASPSFFNVPRDSTKAIDPIDSTVHQPLTVAQMLDKKLRWITLGGQYDWTAKVYPEQDPPPFPPDIARLVQDAFPDMTPEAAIVNVYSPGDTLSLHRDVSEASDAGLVSISMGCEAIFVIGIDSTNTMAIRLRSGDAVYMSGQSRYAWHGVSSTLDHTCPHDLSYWPASSLSQHQDQDQSTDMFPSWKGWLGNKRINLNVRQMRP